MSLSFMPSYIHALGSALYTLTFCHITCFGQLGCSNVDSSKGFEKILSCSLSSSWELVCWWMKLMW